jgi:hypothetical protein
MFFSEEKNQKTFASCAGSWIRDLAGSVPRGLPSSGDSAGGSSGYLSLEAGRR